jgi:hypothetical protein
VNLQYKQGKMKYEKRMQIRNTYEVQGNYVKRWHIESHCYLNRSSNETQINLANRSKYEIQKNIVNHVSNEKKVRKRVE